MKKGKCVEAENELTAVLRAVVQGLVDAPEVVKIDRMDFGDGYSFRIQTASTDMGKVIGVSGRTARSLRVIMGGISARFGVSCSLDIVQV